MRNNSLLVNEIFYSIQGESSFAGTPCIFVRLTGCNLRCSYCDTRYAYENGSEMEVASILQAVEYFSCPLVEITGGEPLMQPGTPELVSRLLERDFRVLVETNGSLNIDCVDSRAVRIVDIKCPSSGEHGCNDLQNLKRLSPHDEIKFVIGDKEDFNYAKQMLSLIPEKPGMERHIHFSPVSGRLDPKDLAMWILDDHLPVRLNLQLHRIIWPEEERGR